MVQVTFASEGLESRTLFAAFAANLADVVSITRGATITATAVNPADADRVEVRESIVRLVPQDDGSSLVVQDENGNSRQTQVLVDGVRVFGDITPIFASERVSTVSPASKGVFSAQLITDRADVLDFRAIDLLD